MAADELQIGTVVEPADPRDRIEIALEFQAALEVAGRGHERPAHQHKRMGQGAPSAGPDHVARAGSRGLRSAAEPVGRGAAILAWRRAALAIDDFRRIEAESRDVPGPELERQREAVQRAITSLGREKKRRHRGPELGIDR